MKFADVIGQDEIKKRLIQTVNDGRISHAQLFLGPEGSGNLAMALAYARYIFCSQKGEHDACGTCSSCIKFNKLVHPDLHFVFPVNTTKSVTKAATSSKFLTEWREAVLANPYQNLFGWLEHIGIENKQGVINVQESQEILRNLSLKAFEGEYKIVIIWMAEKVNPSAANKLLKIIEEPPEKTVFLLVAESQEQMLTTILSRTQLVKFNPILPEKLKEAIISEYGVSPEEATGLAHLAGGNFLEAGRLLKDSEDLSFNRETFIQWMRSCYSRDVVTLVPWVDEFSRIGRERQKNFLRYGLHLFRECLMLHYGDEELLRVEGKESQFIRKFYPFVNGGNAIPLTELFNEAYYAIERNGNPKILFLDLTLNVIKLLRQKYPATA